MIVDPERSCGEVLALLRAPVRETQWMGLFGKKKESAPAAPATPRVAIEDRVPSTPKYEQLTNYLATSMGGYVALDGKKLADSPMSQDDRDAWHAMRTGVDAAMKKLKIRDERRDCLAYLVRDPKDLGVIWVEVDGVRVDRLMASAVEAWEGGPVEPYPVRCTLWGGDKPAVMVHRNKS